MNTDNINWYRKYVKKWSEQKNHKINLVTGDAGMIGDTYIMQKLDISQLVLTLATSQKGSNCILKHFTPFMRSKMETYEASGYYVNMIYTYLIYFDKVYLTKPVTTNPNSGEIYVVGIGFKGITDKEIQKYYDILNSYKVNMCWFNKDDLDKDIVDKILDFYIKISELTLTNNNIRILLCHYKIT
jgi:hypothetical protein